MVRRLQQLIKLSSSMRVILALLSAAALSLASVGAEATTVTSTFAVQVTITTSCTIVSTATLNFGSSQGVLTSNVNQTTTLELDRALYRRLRRASCDGARRRASFPFTPQKDSQVVIGPLTCQ